jgi:hypothetical protein
MRIYEVYMTSINITTGALCLLYRTDIYLLQNRLIISYANILYLLRHILTENQLNYLMKVAPRTLNNYERNCRYLSQGKNVYG